MNSINSNSASKENNLVVGFKDFNIKELLLKYLKHWYWFVLCIIICTAFAYTKLRYSIPLYDVTSTIVISQEDNLTNSGLSAFKELGIAETQDKIENEIQILKSKTLIKNVVEKLKLNILYFYEGRILDIEEYANPAIRLSFTDSNKNTANKSGTLYVKINTNTSFSFINIEGDVLSTHNFNTPVKTNLGTVVVAANTTDFSTIIDKKVIVKVLPVRSVVDNYRARLNIMTVGLKSTVLQIALRDAIILKAENFIDSLIEEYSQQEIQNKNETSKKTGNFINDRLIEISQNLSSVDTEAAKYMSKYGIGANVEGESSRLSEVSVDNNREIENFQVQNVLIQATIDYLKQQEQENNLIPSDLNVDNSSITTDIGKYNMLVLRRKRLLKTSTPKNPTIVKIDDELKGLRAVLAQNLKKIKNQLNIKLNTLLKKRNQIKGKLSQAPAIQKDLREIAREQGVTENLYLWLLQKKEEADITSHITVANSRVIDKASPVSLLPVAPNKKGTYLLSTLLGFLIPFIIIYAKELLNTNVQSKKDIENLVSAPIIGSIPKEKSNKKLVINKTDNTPISEAFRILRSNLEFLLKGINKEKGKTIFVTSSISGEGKTFISSNIAKSLAILGKKVVYVGSDLRLPKFHLTFNLPKGDQTPGLTNYIIDSEIKVEDIIYPENEDGELYLLPPGAIPPNPSILLADQKINHLFAYLEQNFDYIVVDTAPISLVTDTLLISHLADLTVHVVKENYSDKRLLTIPEGYSKEGRLKNLAMLLNYASSNMSGAYGYGYGYNVTPKKNRFKFKK